MKLDFSNPKEYIGDYTNTYITYSCDEKVRSGCASGGSVSSLLIFLLEKKYVDGVFVSRQKVEEGKIVVESFVATTRQEILDCRTSIYTHFPLEKSFHKIAEFKGSVAGVFLPCHLKMLDIIGKKQPELINKIKYKIALFCGGVAEDILMEKVLQRNHIALSNVDRIYSRKGHWRGQTYIEMKDGTEQVMSYAKNWCTYKNAFFYSSRKCFNCDDHFGLEADFCCGDIWLTEMKKEKVKQTAIIAKNNTANKILEQMKEDKSIVIQTIPAEKILKGNKRALVYKFYTAEARKKYGYLIGAHYTKPVKVKSRWNHRLAARIIVFNMKWAKSKKYEKYIFKLPKKLMYLYMCLIRALLSF